MWKPTIVHARLRYDVPSAALSEQAYGYPGKAPDDAPHLGELGAAPRDPGRGDLALAPHIDSIRGPIPRAAVLASLDVTSQCTKYRAKAPAPVAVRLAVAKEGAIEQVTVTKGRGTNVGDCIGNRLASLRFGAQPSPSIVDVSFIVRTPPT